MPLPEAFHSTMQIRVDDKLCGFGSNWECTSGYSPLTSAEALSDAFELVVKPLLLDCLATDVTFEGIYVSSIEPGANLPYRFAANSQPGVRSGESMPANSCAVISLQTDSTTAVRQGRCYVSGIAKSDLVNGTWEPNFVSTQLQALADALSDNLNASGQSFAPRIVQRVIAGSPVGPNLLEIVGNRVTQIPYTQRRRTTKQLGTKG